MADPVSLSLAGVSLATAAGGAGIAAFGAQEAGQAQAGMYGYQAGIATMNQNIAMQNAAYATAAGEVEAQESGMQTRAGVGQTKAIQASSGIDVNSGSTAAVRGSEEEIGAQNQALIRSNAAKRAYGFEVEGAQAEAQTGLYEMAGSQSKTAGGISAISSILGGVSSVSSKWLQGRQSGLFGSSSTPGSGIGPGTSEGAIY